MSNSTSSKNEQHSTKYAAISKLESIPIIWRSPGNSDPDDGRQMVNRYLNGSFSIPGPNSAKLKGLRVDKDDIMSLFEVDSTLDELIILFATKSNGEMTSVLVGLANNLIKTDPTANVVIDVLSPCPQNCPDNLAEELEDKVN